MMFRIVMTLGLLVMIIVTMRPCADATSKFVTGFDEQGSASPAQPAPGTVEEPAATPNADDYERLDPNMSEAELKAAIERAKSKAAGSGADAGVESAAPGSAAPGSAAP